MIVRRATTFGALPVGATYILAADQQDGISTRYMKTKKHVDPNKRIGLTRDVNCYDKNDKKSTFLHDDGLAVLHLIEQEEPAAAKELVA